MVITCLCMFSKYVSRCQALLPRLPSELARGAVHCGALRCAVRGLHHAPIGASQPGRALRQERAERAGARARLRQLRGAQQARRAAAGHPQPAAGAPGRERPSLATQRAASALGARSVRASGLRGADPQPQPRHVAWRGRWQPVTCLRVRAEPAVPVVPSGYPGAACARARASGGGRTTATAARSGPSRRQTSSPSSPARPSGMQHSMFHARLLAAPARNLGPPARSCCTASVAQGCM